MENYQIWEFFQFKQRIDFFFPFLCRIGWFFIQLTRFIIFFLFESEVEAIWLLMQHTSRPFGYIKLTQHRVYNSHIILPINRFPYFTNLGFEYHIFYK